METLSHKLEGMEKNADPARTHLNRKLVTCHEETIEVLQAKIKTLQTDHSRQILDMQQRHIKELAEKDTKHGEEISFLKAIIAKAAVWFPYYREMLRMESLCRLVGFDERQTATLVSGKPLEYAGELYSEEHKWKFTAENVTARIAADDTDRRKLTLKINGQPIGEGFKEHSDKLEQNIRQPMEQKRKGRGFKL